MERNVVAENNKQQWLQKRSKHRRNKYGHIVGEVAENIDGIEISNAFNVQNQEKIKIQENSSNIQKMENTKDWVNKIFGKSEKKASKKK